MCIIIIGIIICIIVIIIVINTFFISKSYAHINPVNFGFSILIEKNISYLKKIPFIVHRTDRSNKPHCHSLWESIRSLSTEMSSNFSFLSISSEMFSVAPEVVKQSLLVQLNPRGCCQKKQTHGTTCREEESGFLFSSGKNQRTEKEAGTIWQHTGSLSSGFFYV